MALKVFSNEGARPNERPYITADKQGRLYINRLAQKEMNALVLPFEVFLAYDEETFEIGITQDSSIVPAGTKTFRFNGKRAYASAKSFLAANHILPNMTEDAHRYFYRGLENGWHMFIRSIDDESIEENDVPDGQTSIEDFSEEAASVEAPADTIEGETDANTKGILDILKEDKTTSFRKLEEKWGFKRADFSKVAKKYNLR